MHFIVTGCLFFWPLLGLDPLPNRWPYPARALLMVLSVPFHTVLGPDDHAEQDAARRRLVPEPAPEPGPTRAATRWSRAASCGPAARSSASPCSGILVLQWIRQSEREAKRIDRALDRAEAEEARPARRRRTSDDHRQRPRRPADRGTTTPDGDAGSVPSAGTYERGNRGTHERRTGKPQPDKYTVLLYSDDLAVRDRIRLAIGSGPPPTWPWSSSTRPPGRSAAILLDTYEIDLMVLDGEAAPAGGLGIARQTKDEYADPPPTCVVIARAADRWLAAFAQVDATLVHPLDPVTTGQTIAGDAPRPAATASSRWAPWARWAEPCDPDRRTPRTEAPHGRTHLAEPAERPAARARS